MQKFLTQLMKGSSFINLDNFFYKRRFSEINQTGLDVNFNCKAGIFY